MSKIPTIAMIPSGYKANKVYSVLPTSGDADLDFARTSTRTRVNEIGLIENLATGVPALDYSDGGCPALLLEPQSTNLITYSEDFSDASWIKANNATINSNVGTSPNGDLTADRLNFDTISGSRTEFPVFSQPSGDYTFSFYAKTESGTRQIEFRTGISGSVFEIATVTTEWQRFSVTQNLSATGNLFPQVRVNDTIGGSILIWGAQLEQLSYATSYIPTSGATATRVAETLSKTGLSNYINSSEGVLYAEIKHLDVSGTFRLLQLSDATQDNRIVLYFNGTNGFIGSAIFSNNIEQYSYLSSINASELTKIAIIYSTNKVATFINGVKVNEQLIAINTPLNLSKLDFSGSGNFFFYGKVKDLRVYNQALTDTELISLTS